MVVLLAVPEANEYYANQVFSTTCAPGFCPQASKLFVMNTFGMA
jgi:hypothetical protein